MDIRKAAFAGSWYPNRASACEKAITEFIQQGPAPPVGGWSCKGGIVPHAGWVYSGRIACNVINRLKDTEPIDVVVIFGMHLHAASPNYMMDRGAWETPFGPLPVSESLAGHLKTHFSFQLESPRRFVEDNTIELQMPFIHYLLAPASVLAVGVAPNNKAFDIGAAVARWAAENDRRVKIIGSTDLTHYGLNYGFTPHGTGDKALSWVRDDNDRRLIDALLDMDPQRVVQEGLDNQNACCAGAAGTALAAARQLGASRATLVDYATSYDVSPGNSFVGYAGVVFH